MKKSKWILFFWPLLALGVSLWLANRQYAWFDTKIKIHFPDASRIQPEKTKIYYKGVAIGLIKKADLAPDKKSVVAQAVLYKNGNDLAVEGSTFYIVSPEISLSGIKGLETIVQGSYVIIKLGPQDAPVASEFPGFLREENTTSTSPSSDYILEAKEIRSVSPGDIITYRGINVGSVSSVDLAKDSTRVLVRIQILNKYVKLVRENTLFWQKEAIHADMGLFGARIEVSSLETIMKGGISMATPSPAGGVVKYGTRFELLEEAPKSFREAQKDKNKYKKEWTPLLSGN